MSKTLKMKFSTSTKLFKISKIAKPLFIVACLSILVINEESNALLLGNLIGCSSLSCRLSALEGDVYQMKSQLARITGDTSIFRNPNGSNNYRPFGGQNMNPNQAMNQNQQGLLPETQQITQATNNISNRYRVLPEIQPQQQLRQPDNQYQALLANQIP